MKRLRSNDLPGSGGTPRAGTVLTTLTSRDGVPHSRSREYLCGCRIKRVDGPGSQHFVVKSYVLDIVTSLDCITG